SGNARELGVSSSKLGLAGRAAITFELNDDPASQDILSDAGFANALYQTLRTRVGGGHGEIDDLLDEATEPVQSSGSPPEMTIRYQNQKGEWRCKGFGRAISKTRTKNARAVKRAARRFLREAFDTENTLDSAVASNSHWLKHAKLLSVT
ncbi:unnamed protein product, partial [Durusdinium trenchii]